MSSSQPIALSDSDDDADLPSLTFKSTAKTGRSQRTVIESDEDDDVEIVANDSSSSGFAVASSRTAAAAPPARNKLPKSAAAETSKQASRSSKHLQPVVEIPSRPVSPAKRPVAVQARTVVGDSDFEMDNPETQLRKTGGIATSSSAMRPRISGQARVDTDSDATTNEGGQPAPTEPSARPAAAAKKKNAAFWERLAEAEKSSPRFSKSFKAKVKGSNSTSMPLSDDRFLSDEDDEQYESEDRPSPHKKHRSRKRRSSSKENGNEDGFIVSDSEPVVRSQRTHRSRSPVHQDKGKGKALPPMDGDSDSSDLPDLSQALQPPTRARRDGLEKMQSSRREKERKERKRDKANRRIVSTPEPSPDRFASSSRRRGIDVESASEAEVRVAASAPRSAKRKRNRDRPRDGKGKRPRRPLFADSDNEDLATRRDSTDEEEASPPRAAKRQSKGKGRKRDKEKKHKRTIESSGSENSSSSAESMSPAPPEDSEDDIDEVENLKLDSDHLIEEKLRPKDDKKERRLDKLRLARARAQRKAENKLRGVIDSEDEQELRDKAEIISSDDDGTEEGDSSIPNMDDYEEDFIIDDGDDAETAKRKAEKHIPIEFTSHAKLSLQDHFKFFIEHLVYTFVFPKNKYVWNDPKRVFSTRAIEKEILGIVNSGASSSIWMTDFRKALDVRPFMSTDAIRHAPPGCDGCNRDRHASVRVFIWGKQYDRENWDEEDSDDEDDDAPIDEDHALNFQLGRFCAEKAVVVHRLMHFAYHAKGQIHEFCEREYRLPRKDKLVSRDRDERDEKKDREAQRIYKKLFGQGPGRIDGMFDELKELLEHGRRIGTAGPWKGGRYLRVD